MKKLIFFLLLLSFTKGYSQCYEDRYSTAVVYYQRQGAGWELGLWPVQKTFGLFAGMNFQKSSKSGFTAETGENAHSSFHSQVYGKLQARINQRIALTGTGGLQDGEKLFFATGLRMHLPLSQSGKIAVFGEPQYGSNGFFVFAGIASRF
ncbi:MAG: hypothetical protein ACO29O_07985 [Chitinophagaceae bacterium]